MTGCCRRKGCRFPAAAEAAFDEGCDWCCVWSRQWRADLSLTGWAALMILMELAICVLGLMYKAWHGMERWDWSMTDSPFPLRMVRHRLFSSDSFQWECFDELYCSREVLLLNTVLLIASKQLKPDENEVTCRPEGLSLKRLSKLHT